jgi:hypothetical protein
MNFFDARNSASAAPPEPLVGDDLALAARRALLGLLDLRPRGARPTCEASTPRSASDQVSTGFFFAAMIPLNDG